MNWWPSEGLGESLQGCGLLHLKLRSWADSDFSERLGRGALSQPHGGSSWHWASMRRWHIWGHGTMPQGLWGPLGDKD